MLFSTFSMRLHFISAKYRIICGAVWDPQGRIISRHSYTPSASPGMHISLDAAGVSSSGCCSQAVIARDQHSSTDGQDHASSLLTSLFLQNGIGNEPSLSPSQILRGSGSLPPVRLMVPAMCSLMLSSSAPLLLRL